MDRTKISSAGFGYSFKAGVFWEWKIVALEGNLVRLNGETTEKNYLREMNSKLIYLPANTGSIFGVSSGEIGSDKSAGIVWANNEKHILEALYLANFITFWPYKQEAQDRYYVENGEVYRCNECWPYEPCDEHLKLE